MMFFYGVVVGLILVGIGWPLSIYPLIVAQASIGHLQQSWPLAFGAGVIIDLMTFQTWPKMTLIYITSTIFIDWLFNKIVIKNQPITVMIILVLIGLILSIGYYLTDRSQSVAGLISLVVFNTLAGLVWPNFINFFSHGRFVQSISALRQG